MVSTTNLKKEKVTGYIHSGQLVNIENIWYVNPDKQGCTLRTKAIVLKSTEKEYIWKNTTVTIIDKTVTWYKISRAIDSNFKTGWVCNMPGYIKLKQ